MKRFRRLNAVLAVAVAAISPPAFGQAPAGRYAFLTATECGLLKSCVMVVSSIITTSSCASSSNLERLFEREMKEGAKGRRMNGTITYMPYATYEDAKKDHERILTVLLPSPKHRLVHLEPGSKCEDVVS